MYFLSPHIPNSNMYIHILQHTTANCNTPQHRDVLGLPCVRACVWEGEYTQTIRSVAVCCSVLQCVAVWLNGSQVCVAVCCSVLQGEYTQSIRSVAVCCSVLQCVAVCCSVLQCVAVCCSVAEWLTSVCCSVLQCVAG